MPPLSCRGGVFAPTTEYGQRTTGGESPYKQGKRGTMTKNTSTTMIRRIGSTVFKVNIFTKEDGADTMEDKILRLIQNEGLASSAECGMMNVPQMNRQSERSAS